MSVRTDLLRQFKYNKQLLSTDYFQRWKMDLIAVDVGNSRISCGRFCGGLLIDTWHYATAAPEQAAFSLSEQSSGTGVALCSVVPEAAAAIAQVFRADNKLILEVRTETHKIISGIYETMGADRICNALAGWKLYGQGCPVVVFDFGTATTLTAITPSGQFAGGLITAGLGLTAKSLHNKAAQLPVLELPDKTNKRLLLAFDTPEAMRAGTILAHVGCVEKWVKAAQSQLGRTITVIATGGWSTIIGSYTNIIDFIDPHLTLKGIYLAAELAADQVDQS